MDTPNTPETTKAAANVPSHRRKQSPSLVRAEGDQQQAVNTALDNPEEQAITHVHSTSQSLPVRTSSELGAATGAKRKRGDDAGEPGDGIKRQMITLPFRGRVAATPSYQEQQILTGSEVQPSNAEPRLSQESFSSPAENQSVFEMDLNATEGHKFLGALFSVVSMNRMLRQRWELYQDCRGKYRRRCHVVESFQTGLKELERKKRLPTINPKHLNEIVEYRNQLNKFTPGRDALEEETSRLLGEHDGLQDEVDASVKDLFLYDDSLKGEEVLQFLTEGANFWKIFEARQAAAKMATESARAKLKAIEEERFIIRSRMEGHFKQIFLDRLAHARTVREDDSDPVAPAKAAPRQTTEQDLRRLSELVLQQRNLKYKEKFRDVKALRAQSDALLKVAESAFVDAELLAPDSNESFQGGRYRDVEQPGSDDDAERSS